MKGGCAVGVIPGMAPTGRLQDGESPDSSVEQSVYVAEKEGGPGQKEGQEVFWLPQPSSALQPQPFSPELPLESLGFENERRELVRRQEEHPPSISSEDQNGDRSIRNSWKLLKPLAGRWPTEE